MIWRFDIVYLQIFQNYNAKSCDAATAYVKRELENILPKWKEILASATKELSDFETMVKDIPDLQRDATLSSDDDIEDEHIEDSSDSIQDEAMHAFGSVYRPNTDQTYADDTKNDVSDGKLRENGLFAADDYFGRTSAKDFMNDDAAIREDERRFEDMKRFLEIRRTQRFNGDVEDKDSANK